MSLNMNPQLFKLSMSEGALPLMDLVKKHCEENVSPIQEEYYSLQHKKEDRWTWHPRQIELLEGAKEKARELGLWNFFLPDFDSPSINLRALVYVAKTDLIEMAVFSISLLTKFSDSVPINKALMSSRLVVNNN